MAKPVAKPVGTRRPHSARWHQAAAPASADDQAPCTWKLLPDMALMGYTKIRWNIASSIKIIRLRQSVGYKLIWTQTCILTSYCTDISKWHLCMDALKCALSSRTDTAIICNRRPSTSLELKKPKLLNFEPISALPSWEWKLPPGIPCALRVGWHGMTRDTCVASVANTCQMPQLWDIIAIHSHSHGCCVLSFWTQIGLL